MATGSLSLRRPLAAIALIAGLLAAAPADAAIVQLKNGEKVDAERYYPTVTAMVVIARNFALRLISYDDIASIDGQAFVRPAPESVAGGPSPVPSESPAPNAMTASPAPATAGLYPLTTGTFRTYQLTQTRTSWHRVNREMKQRDTEQGTGVVKEVIVGADPEGPVAMTETIIERAGDRPSHESSVVHLIDPRTDGYYLLGQTITEPELVPSKQESTISIPPMLFPKALTVGQTWTVGPFRHLGMYTAGRLQVVGQESVTVPAGTYPDAYRIDGFLHVFGGDQHLRAGRLVMEHGTLETTTWFVPGLGPVKEESKFHAHQNFFANDVKVPELPVVTEERATRTLTEFGLGK